MSVDTLKLLEFDQLQALLGNYVPSPLGKEKLSELVPGADLAIIVDRQQLTTEAREYVRSSMAPSAAESFSGSSGRTLPLNFSGFDDPRFILAKAAIEGTLLELPEIADLLRFAERVSDIKRSISATERRLPRLAAEASKIADFHALLRDIGGKILPSGELDDHASTELRRIRKEIDRQRGAIHSSLKNFLKSGEEEASPQDEIITIRSERFVVPVRASRKNRVQGVVHGASSTGQTVYVEPLETIELNNELVRLKEEEQREIQRILAEMTARIRERARELADAAATIATLELAFGCARFALDYDCVVPKVAPANSTDSDSVRLWLKDARHPLLEAHLRRKKLPVVPLSLELKGRQRVLVISGPNTGGKTVALKTAGLLVLMALAGLPVPASEGEVPLFDRVLADIGDYQSIQESLSTFSAHLLNVSSMMELAGPDSLILLDELGSATDPEEAGALGVAIVDRFRSAGAFLIASTHHMLVKAYAMNTPGVLSASMGFDEHTLQPTYQLEIGLPGKSSGISIAQKLGLAPDVLARAREAMSAAHQDVERLLSSLKEQESELASLRQDLENRRAALQNEEKQWREGIRRKEEQRAAEWERQLEQLWRSFEERSEQKLRELAARAPAVSRRIDPKKESARMVTHLREQLKEELRQATISHLGESGEPSPASPAAVQDITMGDRVRLRGLNQVGTVRRRDGDALEVQIGALRTKASVRDVVGVIPSSGASSTASGAFHVRMERSSGASVSEINVIGETAEEARSRVDKFLDNAFLAQVARVRVVHGSGKGILRSTLAEMFSTHPHVEKFFQAPQNEGGAGATIVELKV